MKFVVSFLLCWYIVICWPIYVFAGAGQKALIFSRKTNQIEEISRFDKDKKCYSCITACPADSERSEKFNKKVSFGQSSIFLNEVYEDAKSAKTIDLEKCHEMFKPSILLHKESNSYYTGYELYYGKKKCKLENVCDSCDYDDFQSVVTDVVKKYKTFPKEVSENGETIFQYTSKREMSFFWIPVLFFHFNSAEYQIRITFYPDVINDYNMAILECGDYDLGSKVYESDEKVNFFYSTTNPEEMFDKIDASRQSSNSQIASSSVQLGERLERTQLIPMMFFHTKAGKLATCTYLNTIPVWSSIMNGQLKIVDRYLYTIFRLWYPFIEIVFGVSGELTLNKVRNSETTRASSSANDQNNEGPIKIPKIIYRIVEYHLIKEVDINVNDGDQIGEINDEDSILSHYIVIIIHNDPEAKPKDVLCPLQIRSLLDDWKAIYNDDAKKGLSYACTLNENIIGKLGAYDEAPDDSTRTLNLSAFPLYNNEGSTTKWNDIDARITVENEMKKLFPENAS